jgi:hypothetical protein
MTCYPTRVGLGIASFLTITALTILPARAELPAASLTPDAFSEDLGFENLKDLSIAEEYQDSQSLKAIKTLIDGEYTQVRETFGVNFLEENQLDVTKLFWNGVNPVEVYFINEGAGYKNQLVYSASNEFGEIVRSGMIFENVSSPDSKLANSNGPLQLGQGVSLGGFEGPTQLDFSIISNGYNLKQPGENASDNKWKEYETEVARRTLGTDATKNSDGLQHVVAFQQNDWIILGFEDIIGGGDMDYNDVIFAVRGVQEGAPEDVPEPSALLGMVLLGMGGVMTLRRKQFDKDAFQSVSSDF